jgi:hypothetical protein
VTEHLSRGTSGRFRWLSSAGRKKKRLLDN